MPRTKGLYAVPEEPRESGGPHFKLPHLKSPFAGAKPLSNLEASQLRPIIVEFLKKSAEYADEGMTRTNKARTRSEVWTGPTGLDDKDYDTLAGVLIGRGRLDAVVAQGVRAMASMYVRWEVLLILGPKFLATVDFYAVNGGATWPW